MNRNKVMLWGLTTWQPWVYYSSEYSKEPAMYVLGTNAGKRKAMSHYYEEIKKRLPFFYYSLEATP